MMGVAQPHPVYLMTSFSVKKYVFGGDTCTDLGLAVTSRLRAMYPQPPGRPRKGCTWCTATGQWKPDGAPSGALIEGSQFQWKSGPMRPAIYVESEADRAAKERHRIQEEESRRAFEEESARIQSIEKARAEEEACLAREKERLDAPRRYAASLTHCDSAPRYYFDTKGNFQELGKEGERVVRKKPSTKRVKVTRDEWVYGPDEERLLAEGESELVRVTRWVIVREF